MPLKPGVWGTYSFGPRQCALCCDWTPFYVVPAGAIDELGYLRGVDLCIPACSLHRDAVTLD